MQKENMGETTKEGGKKNLVDRIKDLFKKTEVRSKLGVPTKPDAVQRSSSGPRGRNE